MDSSSPTKNIPEEVKSHQIPRNASLQSPRPFLKHAYHETSLSSICRKFKIKLTKFNFLQNSVTYNTYSTAITNDDIKNIWYYITKRVKVHNWKCLKKVRVVLGGSYKNTDDTLTTLGTQICKYLVSLRNLIFDFEKHYLQNDMSSNSITLFNKKFLLGCGLGAYQHSSYLNLLLINSCEYASNKGLRELGYQINKGLANLRQLSIKFSNCDKMTDNGLKDFGSLIKKHNLEQIAITFFNFGYVSDKGMVAFSQRVCRYFVNLKQLTLNFTGCDGITSKGFKTLGLEIVWHLFKLEQLVLNFGCCKRIGDEGLEWFGAKIVPKLTKLKKITLGFGSCYEISDTGFEALVCQISQHLVNLQQLDLNFGSCSKITDKSFESLTLLVNGNLMSLQKVVLYFGSCANLTDKSLEALGSISSALLYLKSFKVNFHNCPKITSGGKDALRSKLKSIEDFYLR